MAVRREIDPRNAAGVPLELALQSSIRDPPQTNRRVVRSRSQQGTVGGECDCIDRAPGTAMAGEGASLRSVIDPP